MSDDDPGRPRRRATDAASEPPTTERTHVDDPGYDSGPAQTPLASAPLPPENLVDQAVERAAEKVASVTVPSGPPVLSRAEGFTLTAALVILNLAALFVGLQTRSEMQEHRADLRHICQLIVEIHAVEPPNPTAIGRRLAECLR